MLQYMKQLFILVKMVPLCLLSADQIERKQGVRQQDKAPLLPIGVALTAFCCGRTEIGPHQMNIWAAPKGIKGPAHSI